MESHQCHRCSEIPLTLVQDGGAPCRAEGWTEQWWQKGVRAGPVLGVWTGYWFYECVHLGKWMKLHTYNLCILLHLFCFHNIYTEKHQNLDNNPIVICPNTGESKQIKEHEPDTSGIRTACLPRLGGTMCQGLLQSSPWPACRKAGVSLKGKLLWIGNGLTSDPTTTVVQILQWFPCRVHFPVLGHRATGPPSQGSTQAVLDVSENNYTTRHVSSLRDGFRI